MPDDNPNLSDYRCIPDPLRYCNPHDCALLRSESAAFGDASDYVLAANAICLKEPYPEASELPFFRAPGLPLFLALASGCQTGSLWTLKVLNVALDILGMIGIILISIRITASRPAALVAATLYASSPMIIGQALDIQSEALFQVTLIACTLGIIAGTFPAAVLAGGALGAAALTRPVALGFLPIFLCALCLVHHRIKIRRLLGFLFGMALMIAPWTIANQLRTGEFILINDAYGYNLWRGNLPIMQRIYDAKDSAELQDLSRILEYKLTPEMTARTDGMSRRERSAYFEQAAWQQIFSDPSAATRLLQRKAIVFLRPWLDSSAWDWPIVLITGVWESGLYLIGLIGLWVVWKKSRPAALIIGAYLVAALLLNLPFQVVARFRIPFFEWALILLAVPVSAELLRPKRKPQA